MATANGEFIPISQEDLIAAGILPRVPSKPKVEVSKTGCPVKEELKFIKVDEDYLQELRLEATPRDYKNFSIEKGFLKPTSSITKNKINRTSVFNMKRTSGINRRTSNTQKDIAKKAVSNISNVMSSSHQKKGECKFIPITTDMLNAFQDESCKANVRKKLFRTSLSKIKPSDKLFKGPRSSIKSTSIKSPLLDINKAESLLKKSSSLKSVGQQNQFQLNTATRLSVVQEERQSLTPSKSGRTIESARSSTSSTTEFETMEQLCNQQNVKEMNSKIDKVLEMIKIHQEEFEKYKEEFEKYKEANERRLTDITNILKEIVETSKIATISTENKENRKNQRSQPSTPKITPVKREKLTNKPSLRKNVLMMSVGRSQGNTPKEKKAEKMYNSLRDIHGVLETPKFDRKTPSEGNKNFSMKLQEQCLMLSDTPQH